MRKALDALYDGAAWLAALFMIALLVAVLLAIAGRELNFHVRGTDAYAGYFMAAAGFLALAHTLKRGEHIRVTLLLSALPPGLRRGLQLFSHGAAVALSALAAVGASELARSQAPQCAVETDWTWGALIADLDLDGFLAQAGLTPASIEKVNVPHIWTLVTCFRDSRQTNADSH